MSKSTEKLRLIASKPPKVGASLPAPQGLSKNSQLWFEQTRDGFGIADSAGLMTLRIAAEALDEMASVQKELKKTGQYYSDRNGIRRQVPAAHHYDVARRAYFSALKQLRLKV